MDPTKTSRIPTSSPSEVTENISEKKTDGASGPSKINYSHPANHVMHEIGEQSVKDINSPAPKDMFFEFSGIQSTPFKIQKPSSKSPPLADMASQQAGGHRIAINKTPGEAQNSDQNSPITASGNGSKTSKPIPSGAVASGFRMDDADVISEYDAPTIHEHDMSLFEFGEKESRECLKGLSDKGKALAKAHKLTEQEVTAIRAYTKTYYAIINYQMRNLPDPKVNVYDAAELKRSGVNPDMADLIANLVNGLKKLPPAQIEGDIVRGHGRDANLPKDELEKYKEGQIISPSMFTSTTSTLEQMVSNQWWNTNPQTMIIHQVANGNGRDIAAFSLFEYESEILFLPNTKFKVEYREDNVIIGAGVAMDINPQEIKDRYDEKTKKAWSDKYNDPSGQKYKKTIITLRELPAEPEIPAQTSINPSQKISQSTDTKKSFKNSIKNF